MNNAMRLLSMATFFVAALAAADPQLDAARKLITRVVGADKAAHFTLELISPPTNNATNEEYFTLPVSLANNITIRGTNAIALASGFHWYLKYTAHCGIRYGDVKVTDAELPILPAVLKEGGADACKGGYASVESCSSSRLSALRTARGSGLGAVTG